MMNKNEEMELVNDNGIWKIKWNDGFERSFKSFFKAKLHFLLDSLAEDVMDARWD